MSEATDTINADMREFWNGEGGEKWLRFQETIDANLRPFGDKALAAADVAPGEAVLDVGCGCGATTIEIARRVAPDGRVLGLDISEPILARARAQAGALAGNGVAFDCADAQVRRFEAAAFDLIFSRFGVMFFDDPRAAFENLRGALKPGGRLTFVCWQSAAENAWIHLPLEIVARHVALPEPPAPDEPGPLAFADPERVGRILGGAGFSEVAIAPFETSFVVGASLDEALTFMMQMGPASRAMARAEADEAARARIAADLRAALAPRDGGQGISLDAAAWIVTARNP